jgi:hypothetical protein
MDMEAKEPAVKLILGVGAVLAAPLFAGATMAGAVRSAEPATAVSSGGGPPLVHVRGNPDGTAAVTVVNTAGHAVRVTLRICPAEGTVAPGAHPTLAEPDPSRFVLPAHSHRTLDLTARAAMPKAAPIVADAASTCSSRSGRRER